MKSISRLFKHGQPNSGITPSATSAPHRAPSWPRPADHERVWWNLPPENPDLLYANPRAYEAGAPGRSLSCMILGASRADHERMRRTASLADALAFEAAVAENMLILYPGNRDAAACLALLRIALPTVTDHPALPLAVTR